MGKNEHRISSLSSVNVVVVTVSDTRNKKTDESGLIILEILKNNNHNIIDYLLINDDFDAIDSLIKRELDARRTEVIIFNGGTGISSRDVTVEAVEKNLEKRMEGFGELFRYLSYNEIGTASILSRAIAAVAGKCLVIALPGSPGAVKLAMEKIIIPEICHMVYEINK